MSPATDDPKLCLREGLGLTRGEYFEQLQGLWRKLQGLPAPAQLAGIQIEHEVAERYLCRHRFCRNPNLTLTQS